MFHKLKNIFDKILRRWHRPGMIYGITHQGIYLKDSRISNTTVIENPQGLKLDDNVFIGHFNYIEASNGIVIEEGCQVTNYVSLISHSSHKSIRYYGKHYREFKEHKGYVKGEIHLGAYTFVGPHSLVLPGTKIGKGCLVQAYSMVKGNFEDYSIIGGSPAKKIGDTRTADQRFLKANPDLMAYYKEWAE